MKIGVSLICWYWLRQWKDSIKED